MTGFNAAAVTHVLSTPGEIIIASKRIGNRGSIRAILTVDACGSFKNVSIAEMFGKRFHAVTTMRPHAGEPAGF